MVEIKEQLEIMDLKCNKIGIMNVSIDPFLMLLSASVVFARLTLNNLQLSKVQCVLADNSRFNHKKQKALVLTIIDTVSCSLINLKAALPDD